MWEHVNMALPTNDEIATWLAANEKTPDLVASKMRSTGVNFDNIYQALQPYGKTSADIGKYVSNSNNPWLQGEFAKWSGNGLPITATTNGNGTTNTGSGLTNTGAAVNAAQTAAITPASDPLNAANPAIAKPASLSEDIKALLSGLSGFQPARTEMPAAPGPFVPTQAQLDGIDSSKRISGLLAADSPVLQQALARANAAANSKGLLNSSMATEAGTQALISEAQKIADSDSNRFGSLINAGIGQDTTLGNTALSGQVNSALRDNQNAFDWQSKLAGAGIDLNKSNTDWAQKMQADALTRTANREDTATANARTDTLSDRGLQEKYAGSVQSITTKLADRVRELQASDLPAPIKESQINSEIAIAKAQVNLTNQIYTNLPQWRSEWSTLALEIPGGA